MIPTDSESSFFLFPNIIEQKYSNRQRYAIWRSLFRIHVRINVNCVGMYLSGKCRSNVSEMFIKRLLLKLKPFSDLKEKIDDDTLGKILMYVLT